MNKLKVSLNTGYLAVHHSALFILYYASRLDDDGIVGPYFPFKWNCSVHSGCNGAANESI